jgi:predicted  nucleic acid-binding Zn-ribbon protein
LKAQFDQELERSLQRIQDAIAPYTRFVRAERAKLTTTRSEFDEIQKALTRLEAKVNDL